MAKPIEPTPPLDAEDSERLLRDLEQVCSPEEARRREEWAARMVAEMMRTKGRPDDDSRRD